MNNQFINNNNPNELNNNETNQSNIMPNQNVFPNPPLDQPINNVMETNNTNVNNNVPPFNNDFNSNNNNIPGANNIQQEPQNTNNINPNETYKGPVEVEDNISKAQKTLRNDFIVILIIDLIGLTLAFTSKEGEINIFTIVYTILTVFGIFLTTNYPKYSWIVGIIIGLAMALSILVGDIIDALLGIFVIIHSIVCLVDNLKKKKA